MSSFAPKFSQSKQVSFGVGRAPSSEKISGKRDLDSDDSRPIKNLIFGADGDYDDSEYDNPLSHEVSVFSKGSTENTLAKDQIKFQFAAFQQIYPAQRIYENTACEV